MSLLNIEKPSKFIFITLILIQLVSMLIMSQDVGISADENRHYKQAEKVYGYYLSKGEDKSALEKTGIDPMQFNGQFFDNIMFAFEKLFNVEKVMEMRHFFNALLGWLIILITGLFAKKYWGYKAAILTIIFLFISPRFIGHSLNNNKDIPFALGFILSTFGTLIFIDELPKVKKSTILLLIIGIAFSISIRIAGVLSIGLLGLFAGVKYLFKKPYFSPFKKEKLQIIKKTLILIPIISIVSYGLGILFWPYLFENPIEGFKDVFNATETHPVALNQLFKGKIFLSTNLPSNYVITYILYTYPLLIFAGSLFAFTLIPFRWRKENLLTFSFLTFSFLFVIIWMSFKNSNIYGGIRHILFIYPIIVLISVRGFLTLHDLLKNSKNRILRYVPLLFILILSILPARHIIKNYPYSYIYFNEFAGGVKANYSKFETDYFQHSLRHATEWFIENEIDPSTTNDSTTIKVITNDFSNTNYYFKKEKNKIELEYSRYYEKYNKQWDYAIFYCAYISPHQLKNNLWPPKGTIHTEDVDGFPIAAVVKRISDEDLKGFNALKKNKTADAKKHFKAFLELYPENEEVLEGYARACLKERKLDSTIIYADSSLIYNPRQIGALFLKTSALNYNKEYQKALAVCAEMIKIKESFAEGRYQKGIALKNLNKPNEALKEFQLAITYKKDYYEAYMRTGDILINYKKYNDAINKVYKKVLAFRKRDLNTIVNTAKCYHFLKQNNNAEELLKEIPKANKNNLYVVMLKARIELGKGNFNSSAQLLNMARNIKNNSELFVIRALFVLAKNNKALAKQYLDKAVELDSTNREASELLKKVQSTIKPKTKQTQNPQKSIMFQKNTKKKQNPFNLLQNK